MDRVVKVDANQASFDLVNKTIADFDVPQLGTINLADSYVSIRTTASASDSGDSGTGAGGISNPYLKFALDSQNDLAFSDMAVLVKNAYMASKNKGKIEDIRKVDLLKNTLSVYNDDLAQINGPNKLANLDFSSQQNVHLQNEISKNSGINSRDVSHDIHIPLKNIFNSCKSENYDSDGAGNTRVHLEFNFNKLSAASNNRVRAADVAGYKIEGSATLVYNALAPIAATEELASVDSVSPVANFKNLPYYIGQSVSIVLTGTGNPTVKRLITNIVRKADNKITYTFNSALTVAPAGGWTAVQMLVNNSGAVNSLTIDSVQMVLAISQEAPAKQLNYSSFMSEEDSYPAAHNASRLYQLPPATKNCYVMFYNSTDDTQARSDNAHLSTYRITLDNQEVTTRTVAIGGPQHRDLISQVYANNGNRVGNLREKQLLINSGNADAAFDPATVKDVFDGKNCRMIAFPVPFKPTVTLFQLELNGTAALSGHHIVYSEVVKQV